MVIASWFIAVALSHEGLPDVQRPPDLPHPDLRSAELRQAVRQRNAGAIEFAFGLFGTAAGVGVAVMGAADSPETSLSTMPISVVGVGVGLPLLIGGRVKWLNGRARIERELRVAVRPTQSGGTLGLAANF